MAYRIQEYKDGYGTSHFRIQRSLWILPIWLSMFEFDGYYSAVVEFSSHSLAKDWLRSVLKKREDRKKSDMRIKVKGS